MVTAPSVTTLRSFLASRAEYRVATGGGNDSAFNVCSARDTRRRQKKDLLRRRCARFDVDADRVDRQPVLAITADERARADVTGERCRR
jgi:hypothetical protein